MSYPLVPIRVSGAVPIRMHRDDAAFDLAYMGQSIIYLESLERAKVPCSFSIEIPDGYVGLVCPRSGLALREGLTVLNAPGIIDPGYRGEVAVIIVNLGHETRIIDPGDRIAQLLIVPTGNFRLISSFADALSETSRGQGGFGSTGP